MEIDDNGTVSLGPGMADPLGLRQAIRESIVEPSKERSAYRPATASRPCIMPVPYPWPFPSASPTRSRLGGEGRSSSSRTRGQDGHIPRKNLRPGPKSQEVSPETKPVRLPTSADASVNGALVRAGSNLAAAPVDGSAVHVGSDRSTKDYGTPQIGSEAPTAEYDSPQPDPAVASSTSNPFGRSAARGPSRNHRPNFSGRTHLSDFEARRAHDESASETEEDEPVDDYELDPTDAKHWAAWRHELECADADEGWHFLSEPVDGKFPVTGSLVPLTSGKMPRDLTAEEVKSFPDAVNAGKRKEITGLFELGCFERKSRLTSAVLPFFCGCRFLRRLLFRLLPRFGAGCRSGLVLHEVQS